MTRQFWIGAIAIAFMVFALAWAVAEAVHRVGG